MVGSLWLLMYCKKIAGAYAKTHGQSIDIHKHIYIIYMETLKHTQNSTYITAILNRKC